MSSDVDFQHLDEDAFYADMDFEEQECAHPYEGTAAMLSRSGYVPVIHSSKGSSLPPLAKASPYVPKKIQEAMLFDMEFYDFFPQFPHRSLLPLAQAREKRGREKARLVKCAFLMGRPFGTEEKTWNARVGLQYFGMLGEVERFINCSFEGEFNGVKDLLEGNTDARRNHPQNVPNTFVMYTGDLSNPVVIGCIIFGLDYDTRLRDHDGNPQPKDVFIHYIATNAHQKWSKDQEGDGETFQNRGIGSFLLCVLDTLVRYVYPFIPCHLLVNNQATNIIAFFEKNGFTKKETSATAKVKKRFFSMMSASQNVQRSQLHMISHVPAHLCSPPWMSSKAMAPPVEMRTYKPAQTCLKDYARYFNVCLCRKRNEMIMLRGELQGLFLVDKLENKCTYELPAIVEDNCRNAMDEDGKIEACAKSLPELVVGTGVLGRIELTQLRPKAGSGLFELLKTTLLDDTPVSCRDLQLIFGGVFLAIGSLPPEHPFWDDNIMSNEKVAELYEGINTNLGMEGSPKAEQFLDYANKLTAKTCPLIALGIVEMQLLHCLTGCDVISITATTKVGRTNPRSLEQREWTVSVDNNYSKDLMGQAKPHPHLLVYGLTQTDVKNGPPRLEMLAVSWPSSRLGFDVTPFWPKKCMLCRIPLFGTSS